MFKIERKNEKGTKGERENEKKGGERKRKDIEKEGDEQFDLFSVMFAMKCMIL